MTSRIGFRLIPNFCLVLPLLLAATTTPVLSAPPKSIYQQASAENALKITEKTAQKKSEKLKQSLPTKKSLPTPATIAQQPPDDKQNVVIQDPSIIRLSESTSESAQHHPSRNWRWSAGLSLQKFGAV